jgi:hypothetical protein
LVERFGNFSEIENHSSRWSLVRILQTARRDRWRGRLKEGENSIQDGKELG